MMVPSARLVTLIPLIDQVPADATVVVWAVVLLVPSVATTEMLAPTSPVPLAVVESSLLVLIGLVTEVSVTSALVLL